MRQTAQLELAGYLARYPEDAPRLNMLALQLREDEDDPLARSNMRGHITTSALVLSQDLKAVLLIHHNVYQRWVLPGGHFEGDALLASALREVLEETGVSDVAVHGDGSIPFDVDTHAILANAKKREGAHLHHDFVYLLRATCDVQLVPQLEEVSEARWMALADYAILADPRAYRMYSRLQQRGALSAS